MESYRLNHPKTESAANPKWAAALSDPTPVAIPGIVLKNGWILDNAKWVQVASNCYEIYFAAHKPRSAGIAQFEIVATLPVASQFVVNGETFDGAISRMEGADLKIQSAAGFWQPGVAMPTTASLFVSNPDAFVLLNRKIYV